MKIKGFYPNGKSFTMYIGNKKLFADFADEIERWEFIS